MNRGAGRLNKDVAASDHRTSAQHPRYQQVTIKGFGTGFNLEKEIKTVRKKKLKRVHQTSHLIPLPLKASAQSRKEEIINHQQLCLRSFFCLQGRLKPSSPSMKIFSLLSVQ